MIHQTTYDVFLSYSQENEDLVESLARRLQVEGRLSFWFAPWHAVPGVPRQDQTEQALWTAESCAVFISSDRIEGWQSEQMRAAIQARVEDDPGYRVIPVLLPGTARPSKRDLPRFLRLYEPVEFRSLDDERAFKYLLSGILGIPPIQVEGFSEAAEDDIQPSPSPETRTDEFPAPSQSEEWRIDPDNPPISAIRKLLLAAFTEQTLRRFCQDRRQFRAIIPSLGSGQGLDDTVDKVIQYCEKRLVWDELLAEVKQENPNQYERFQPELRGESMASS